MLHLDRRGFLALVGATFAIDPERLMWTPGKKLISIPTATLEPTMDDLREYWRHTAKAIADKYDQQACIRYFGHCS